ncbi:surface lipoprotein assembly modifier [Thiomicrorhabdus lithotrophica]|uniref:Surface lipoprotein assembly modifier n=1 Tax=Thiomicrorhabdus lithotrophica TaxID=2949997 RepID=A0ABY8C9L8_9GAMM|nr:surface lipoprotein assembly modifier [Thiomicrorhabdus lithotrophica]WEJ62666.1 surface lipoprotein assembly modifier [Thiomicrorhabdus lithotrophica]
MKFSKRLLVSSIALTTSLSALATEPTDYDIFNQQFIEALEMRESGDVFSSIEMLEKLIDSQPQFKRAQLELAVAYFRATLFSQAKSHAETVLSDPSTPPEVKETIELFLSQLADVEQAEAENRHTFKGSIGLGIGHDTNINASPTDSIININGIEFTLATASVAQEENYGAINLQLNHSYRVPGTFGIGSRPVKMEWNSALGLSRKAYQDTGDYNLDVMTVVTGPNLISSTDWRAGVNLRADHISLGDTQLGLFTGLHANYTLVDKANEYTVTAEVTNQEYNSTENKGREGVRYGLGTEIQHQFSQELLATAGLNYSTTDAKDENKQHTVKSINTGLYYSAWENALIYGQLGYKTVDYDGVEPIYNIGRNDSEVSAIIGATYSINSGYLANWIINGRISRYNNTSDVSIYEYERTDAMLELSKRF